MTRSGRQDGKRDDPYCDGGVAQLNGNQVYKPARPIGVNRSIRTQLAVSAKHSEDLAMLQQENETMQFAPSPEKPQRTQPEW